MTKTSTLSSSLRVVTWIVSSEIQPTPPATAPFTIALHHASWRRQRLLTSNATGSREKASNSSTSSIQYSSTVLLPPSNVASPPSSHRSNAPQQSPSMPTTTASTHSLPTSTTTRASTSPLIKSVNASYAPSVAITTTSPEHWIGTPSTPTFSTAQTITSSLTCATFGTPPPKSTWSSCPSATTN